MREALQLSESATEMNSHHLDCTITGGGGGMGRGGKERGENRRLSGLFTQSRILEVGLTVLSLSAS